MSYKKDSSRFCLLLYLNQKCLRRVLASIRRLYNVQCTWILYVVKYVQYCIILWNVSHHFLMFMNTSTTGLLIFYWFFAYKCDAGIHYIYWVSSKRVFQCNSFSIIIFLLYYYIFRIESTLVSSANIVPPPRKVRRSESKSWSVSYKR